MGQPDGITPFQKGLSYFGIVSQIISPTEFLCPGLDGFGDPFFQSWAVWVALKNDGTGDAPQDDKEECTAYVSSTGYFRIASAWDTSPLSVGDTICLMHPFLAENVNIVDQPSNNVKESLPAEVSTHSITLVKVGQIPFTGKVGGARVKFDLRIDSALGTASAVIYKNGVPVTVNPAATPVYMVYTDSTGVYQTFTQDISGLSVGDLIQIYAEVNAAPRIAYVRNFTISYDIVSLPSVQAAIDSVYFDSIRGVSGTEWPIGSAGSPVNNWTDAKAIAIARNLTTIKLVNGVITLDANTSGFKFIGNNFIDPLMLFEDNVIELNGFTLSNCSFDSISIHNAAGGSVDTCGPFNCPWCYADTISNCVELIRGYFVATSITGCSDFENSQIFAGSMTGCSGIENCIIGVTSLTSCTSFVDCEFAMAGTMTGCGIFQRCGFLVAMTMINCSDFVNECSGVVDMTLDMTGFTGNGGISYNGAKLTIINLTVGVLNISGEFSLIIAASCTGGTINVYGDVVITNNTGGTVVNDYTILSAISAAASPTNAGALQVKEKTIDLNQAAASYTLFTGTAQVVDLEKLVIQMPTGVPAGALTGISIQTDDATPQPIILATQGLLLNLTSENQLTWEGIIRIRVGKRIQLTIVGGATGVAYVCSVDVQYRAVVSGGTLT